MSISPERKLPEPLLHVVSPPEENVIEFPQAPEDHQQPVSIESAYLLSTMATLITVQDEIKKQNGPLLDPRIVHDLDEELERQIENGLQPSIFIQREPGADMKIYEKKLEAWEEAERVIASESFSKLQKKQQPVVRPLFEYLHQLYEIGMYDYLKPRPPQNKR